MVVRHDAHAAAPATIPWPFARCRIVLLAVALLGACKEGDRLAAPPTPKVAMAQPLQRPVTPYLEATGSVVAVDTADLVASSTGSAAASMYTSRRIRHPGGSPRTSCG
jgi:multidrug efflux pump subunit AcrA (membrane-fusion protein)